ncbi:MAG: ABC transporter ATP-binding protein, partial [Clostridia bacterium]|nr:ABC transporter ATP-binding protein [Clostridia bacterium]
MIKRFISYYKPHIPLFTADMIASVLISILGMIYPVMTNRMLNDFIPNRAYNAIIISGLSVLVLYVARMFLRYFVQYQGHMVGTRMQAQMRRELFVHLERLPYTFFDDHETGKIMTRMTNDLFEVSELAHHGPENLLTCSIMIVLSFVYLCTINVWLTLIVFACVPLLVVTSLHYRKKMSDAFTERRKSNAVINAALESSITGIRVTKAYTNADRELEKFETG